MIYRPPLPPKVNVVFNKFSNSELIRYSFPLKTFLLICTDRNWICIFYPYTFATLCCCKPMLLQTYVHWDPQNWGISRRLLDSSFEYTKSKEHTAQELCSVYRPLSHYFKDPTARLKSQSLCLYHEDAKI